MSRSPWLTAGFILSGWAGLAAAQDAAAVDLFTQLDKNKDGKLTADEVPEGQARFFERIVRVGDAEKDGVVTQEEFKTALKDAPVQSSGSGDGGRGGRPGGFGDGMRPNPEELFRRLDQNGDGKLTREELPEQARERMGQVFDRLGTDSIDLDKFRQFSQMREGGRPRDDFQSPPRDGERMSGGNRGGPGMDPGGSGRGPQGGRGPAFIMILDEDQNGRISKAEFINVAKLFAELDHNQDGELDSFELMGGPGPGGGMMGEGPGGRGRPEEGGRPGGRQFGERRPEGASSPDGERRMEGRGPGSGGFNFDPAQIFARMDANSDGFISESEAPERMQQNFANIDTDGDKKISPDEFRSNMEAMRRRMSDQGPRGGDGNRPESGDRPNRPQRPQ